MNFDYFVTFGGYICNVISNFLFCFSVFFKSDQPSFDRNFPSMRLAYSTKRTRNSPFSGASLILYSLLCTIPLGYISLYCVVYRFFLHAAEIFDGFPAYSPNAAYRSFFLLLSDRLITAQHTPRLPVPLPPVLPHPVHAPLPLP